MVLPLIGSFLASSFLPGMTGMTALTAGALGAGLGSLAQGDSLEDAVTTGFTSFLGGKLLGGLGAAGKGGEALKDGVSQKALTTATEAPDVLGQAMKTTSATKGIFGAPTMNTVADPVNLLNRPEGLGLFDAAKLGLKQGAANVMANPMAAAGSALGTQVGQALTAPPPEIQLPSSNYQRTETQPYPQNVNFPVAGYQPYPQNVNSPVAGYQPGISPELNYGFYNPSASQLQTKVLKDGGLARYAKPSMMGMSTKLSSGGLAALAEGGDVAEAAEMPNEKEVIVNAVNAVKGNMPEEQAAIVLAQFVQTYGEDALKELVEDVRKGEYDNVGGKADGMVDGGGDGMSDSVPATIDGQQDLLVSKDEYVVDAPTVAMIGNGSSDAGAEKLDKMREEVRKAATGSRIQPKKIDAEGIMSLALAS